MFQHGYLTECFDFNADTSRLLDLFADEPFLFFLDSSQMDPCRGRFSFIGFDPFDVFVHKGPDALERLKEKFKKYAGEDDQRYLSDETPLTAGVVGALSYDFGLYQEKIARFTEDDQELPDCAFGFYDLVITVDHFKQKLIVTSTGLPEADRFSREKRAQTRAARVIERLRAISKPSGIEELHLPECLDGPDAGFCCNFTKKEYCEAVSRALEYIACGDIYQVNLSQRYYLDLNGITVDPLAVYRSLRRLSPSPFGAYMDAGDFKIISNSPERFLSLSNGIVQARPMKGTRPRGVTAGDDEALRREINDSMKEKAELLMITDLLRNDLGKVCDYGSISVKALRAIEEYNYVFQATSTIEGRLRKDRDCFDLIGACFPGGSVTGCPKIRAMEVIEELEPHRRGFYTGSMGYVNFSGTMDFNILIRTVLARGTGLYFQVGGGIVADSTPEAEYEETLIKAKAMSCALRQVYARESSRPLLKVKA